MVLLLLCLLAVGSEKMTSEATQKSCALLAEPMEDQTISGRDIYAIRSRTKPRAKRNKEVGDTPTKNIKKSSPLTSPSSKPKSKGNPRPSKSKGNSNNTSPKRPYDSASSDTDPSLISTSEEEEGPETAEEDEEFSSIAAQLNQGQQEANIEDYFTAQVQKLRATSDHTLSQLANPRMDMKQVHSTLPDPFKDAKETLFKEYHSQHRYWLFQMSHGFNILLYGLGSKRKVLEDFCQKNLSQSCHLLVNGFYPGLTIKKVLTTLSSDLLSHTGTFKTHLEHALYIQKTLDSRSLEDKELEVFIVVHNIEGPMLRSDGAQTSLSILAECPSIHIIASIDHINAPLLWDEKKLGRFNWAWHDTTTFETYKTETSYENLVHVKQLETIALSSLVSVTQSLTANAQGIFEVITRYQLDNEAESGSYLGMSHKDCYTKCRDNFLVNNNLTFKMYLVEFRDHKLLKSRCGQDGVEYLYIPISKGKLQHFVEEHLSKEE